MNVRRHLVAAAGLAAFCAPGVAGPPDLLAFDASEQAAIQSHGPWPPQREADPSNRLSGRPEAVAFGRKLFFDVRMSARQERSCASCHDPARHFAGGDPRFPARRDTPSLLNVRYLRWHGWGGAADSIWAASLRPLADTTEMGPGEREVARRVRETPDLAQDFTRATGRSPPADDDDLLADLGKSLAAFQETLVSPRTAFDDFRDALARGDSRTAQRYPVQAQRGLRLFIGPARCASCHSGPLFTHGEFDQAGIPVRKPDGSFDWGRYEGVKQLRASRFNLLSRHNDDPTRADALKTRHAALDPQTYGSFKVPPLRQVAATAPYMHDGSLPDLESVVRHYATLDEIKLHIASAHPHPEPGEPLPPRPVQNLLVGLQLSEQDIQDLVAFLRTVTKSDPVASDAARRSAPR